MVGITRSKVFSSISVILQDAGSSCTESKVKKIKNLTQNGNKLE